MSQITQQLILKLNRPPCKYCQSKNIRKYGLVKGIQRYYCNDCRRKFVSGNTIPKMQTPRLISTIKRLLIVIGSIVLIPSVFYFAGYLTSRLTGFTGDIQIITQSKDDE